MDDFINDLGRNPTLDHLHDGFGEPDKENLYLQLLGEPHVDSFNFLLEEGLTRAIDNLIPIEFQLPNQQQIKLTFQNGQFGKPQLVNAMEKTKTLYPSECRQKGSTYQSHFTVELKWYIDDIEQESISKDMGFFPIMLMSKKCNLYKMTSSQLIAHHEHPNEWGGYFIIKGHEKLIRMLIMTRRNYPIAISRSGWKQRGVNFTDIGVLIRCVTLDETEINNVLHFTSDGQAKLMFSYKKVLYYVPVILILKCLLEVPDIYIFKCLLFSHENDLFLKSCITNMLRDLHVQGINTHLEAKEYIGRLFRVTFDILPPWTTNSEICDFILKNLIGIHLDTNEEKFNLLIFMTQKLYAYAQNRCFSDGVDTIMMNEVLLGGHLYLRILKEKLQYSLEILKRLIIKKSESETGFTLNQMAMSTILKKSILIQTIMTNFLATGSINTPSGLGLLQNTGLVIIAENINRMRHMSHFRAVHRGSFFQEMRTTEPRQLHPDAWGFICPVHTPDGVPCGLLNHLSKYCKISKNVALNGKIQLYCQGIGMIPLANRNFEKITLPFYNVLLDGKIIGFVLEHQAQEFTNALRSLKINSKDFPDSTEIVLVPIIPSGGGQFPGIFIFTGSSRFLRPVFNLKEGKIEMISSFEQIFMEIAISKEEYIPGITTHMEISETSFLSNLACLIPMPDCNQSPRNMYQCQMGKQTMGTPCHNYSYQSANKLYRLQTPATPFFRPTHHDLINMDNFPMGTNAIVAVISYTGYDMEDALIINKASQERGFGTAIIYKSEFIELTISITESYFELKPDSNLEEYLDKDGLPRPGSIINYQDPYYCYMDGNSSKYVVKTWKNIEPAYVDNVKIIGASDNYEKNKACITLRLLRYASIGDKFASRAGQKGICSQQWPQEDMPFSESGLVPDIIFNPHGFPSRMTIAMMIELMAGKSASVFGHVYDATPFKFSEKQTAIDYFGQLLEKAGYNYYGKETMYSGITGVEFQAQIYFGVVHYQRLRHMVYDKWQVRRTGPIDTLTQQPIKGRRREGGIRFGEMERDALLSHGSAFLLQDRLFHCSDKFQVLICCNCGCLLAIIPFNFTSSQKKKPICKLCQENSQIEQIEIPYIFKYFVTQLASLNINVKLDLKKV